MRRYAFTGLVLGTPGDEGMQVETPGDPGRGFRIHRADFDAVAKHDGDRMTLGQALLFAGAGRRIARAAWTELPFGALVIHDGQLQWELDATMHVMIPSLDLLARDWIVL